MEIGRGIFTGWFHLGSPLPLFSRDIHLRKAPFVGLPIFLAYRCVCPCVRRPYNTSSGSRSLAEEKKELLYPRTLTKPVVVDCNKRGKSGYGVAEEAKRKGGREEWAEVAGQGTQSSGIKPSRLLPTSREFSPFSPSDPASCSPSRVSLR